MKKKALFGIIGLAVLIGAVIFAVNMNNGAKDVGTTGNVEPTSSAETVETKMSFYQETFLFHSKKSMEYILSLNKDNKLIGYEYIEKYYDFDETGGDFELICSESPAEAVNNTKIFPFLTEEAECDRAAQAVTITDVYDISKFESKDNISKKEIANRLDDNYILDVEGVKADMVGKGYVYKEME